MMLLEQDEKKRWYFTRGKYAPELLDDMSTKEHKNYLLWLINEDAGRISLEGRKAIEQRLSEIGG